jgi:hypothetical protein
VNEQPASTSRLQRRLARANGPALTTLRRRRRIAQGLAAIAGVTGFFTLYVLSWLVVLDM